MAGPDPIRSYEVRAGQRVLASLPFRPQLSEAPLTTWVDAAEAADGQITVIASAAMPRARGYNKGDSDLTQQPLAGLYY